MNKAHCLYSYRRCPYAIRARYTLAYAEISYQVIEISLRAKPIEMLALSPKGTVPVLQVAQGAVIDESIDIMQWALRQHDPLDWLQQHHKEQINSLILANDTEFKPLLDRYKYPERYAMTQQTAHQHTLTWLRALEQRLQQQDYLVSDRFSLADAAIFPFIRQYRGVDPFWFEQSEFKKLKVWLEQILASERFQFIMQKHDGQAFV